MTVDAVLGRDYPTIQALILVFSFIYINLLVDVSYTFLDPEDPLLSIETEQPDVLIDAAASADAAARKRSVWARLLKNTSTSSVARC